MSQDELIYLDYNATTPVDPRVLASIQPFLRGSFGNAASRHHSLGRQASEAVEEARAKIAAAIGADPREIYFTSGATESNNLALQGIAAAPTYAGRRGHIITVRTEHRAVLDPCLHLEEGGHELTLLQVDGQGRLDLEALKGAIRDDTLLVSVMHGNNEIGVLHPLAEIGKICRERGVLFHTDATQSFGKEPIDVDRDYIDALSFSAHKMCGPKGVGGLYLRRRGPRVRCAPLFYGGGHERELRSGTLNVPGIVGMGVATQLCVAERDTEQPRIRGLRDELQVALLKDIDGTIVNGGEAPRMAGTLNVSLPGIDAEILIGLLPDLAISTASACSSSTLQPSYVLGALGLNEELLTGSIRISLGRFTTPEEIGRALELIVGAARSVPEGDA